LGSKEFTQAEENAEEKPPQHGVRQTKLLKDWEKPDQAFAEKDSPGSNRQGFNEGESHS
jgi:hypothetical protein